MKTHQELVDEVMDNFEFEKVKRVMDYLGWEWSSLKGVPEVRDLRKKARELMREALRHEAPFETAIGGFWVNWYGDGHLRLSFCVDEWETWGGG